MTDPDLQELAELWQEPSPAEQEVFEAAARRARRQGKLLAWADIALAVLLVVGTFLGLVLKPGPLTIAVAVVMIPTTTYVMWKRRALRQMSPTLKTGDRQAFLESSVRLAVSNVRRITLSLYFVPVGIAIGVLFKTAMRHGGTIDHPLERFAAWLTSPRGVLTLTIGAALLAWTYRRKQRAEAELARLRELQTAYEEADRSARDIENH